MSRFIRLDLIDRHPDAGLFPHEEEHVQRLAADIASRGITTPVHVAPEGGRFLLLTGHDRVEAAKRAGLSEVPADVRSTVITDAERFEYFVKDNTLRKDVDKRAVARAVWLRYPNSKVQDIADRAGVSTGTAYNAREDAIREAPQLFKVEKVDGADGKSYPRTYAPREPRSDNGGSGAAIPHEGDSATQPGPEAGNRVSGEPFASESTESAEVKVQSAPEPEPESETNGNRLAVHHSSESGEWYTPAHIIAAVVETLGAIDLDPCSNPGEPAIPAARHFTYLDDGLVQEWGGRVYMNPPYGRGIGDWTEKLRLSYEAGEVVEAIALVPARTDTGWMHALRDYARCFIRGRLSFSGHDNAAPFPSCAVYFGPHPDRFARAFAAIGDTFTLLDNAA